MWKVLSREYIFKGKIFSLRKDRCQLQDGRIMPKYFVLEFPTWVHVLPLTSDNEVILVKQYRHAGEDFFLEIPGGVSDPDSDKTSLDAAKRELLEETGYVSDQWTPLPEHSPNPALQSNRIACFIARNCQWKQKPNLDPFEEIEVIKMPLPDLYKKLDKGELTHSLIIATLTLARPLVSDSLG